jgi:hypothetical protein
MNNSSLLSFPVALQALATLVCLTVFGAGRLMADPAPAAPDKTLRVFLFAGQSNMVGSDSRAEHIALYPPFAGLEQARKDVKFAYCIGREDKARSEGWTELRPVNNTVGPELSFARRVGEHSDGPIAIIKCAAGGTTLGTDWNPDKPDGFKLYPLALDLVRASLADLDRRKIKYRLEGFMWHQGENDMFDDAFRASYAQNLANFIASWRRDLQAPQLRFYIGELCTKTIWGMDNRAPMHAIGVAQRAVAEADPLVDFVPTAHIAIEIGGDAGLHYHYGTLGQLEHGVNHADAYLRTIGKEPKNERTLARWPYAKDAPVKLFVLAGHRNMEGERAFVQQLQALKGKEALAKDNTRIAYTYSVGGGYKVSNGWEPLGPAGCYDTFGPELSFGATLASGLARKGKSDIAIAKYTHSGSQVVDWTPEGSEAQTRNLYPDFIKFVRASVQDLKDRGHEVELAGVFYHLGENDMSFGPYRRKAVAQLAALVAQSRKDLGLPSLPWFVSQQPAPDDTSANITEVTAELQRLATADANFIHIKAFDLPGWQTNGTESKLVITTPGIVALGELLAEGYLRRR